MLGGEGVAAVWVDTYSVVAAVHQDVVDHPSILPWHSIESPRPESAGPCHWRPVLSLRVGRYICSIRNRAAHLALSMILGLSPLLLVGCTVKRATEVPPSKDRVAVGDCMAKRGWRADPVKGFVNVEATVVPAPDLLATDLAACGEGAAR